MFLQTYMQTCNRVENYSIGVNDENSDFVEVEELE